MTGACAGLPLSAACGAKEEGGRVVGISPGLSLEEHVGKYGSPTEFHDVLIFTGSGLMGREVVNIRSSDIVVVARHQVTNIPSRRSKRTLDRAEERSREGRSRALAVLLRRALRPGVVPDRRAGTELR